MMQSRLVRWITRTAVHHVNDCLSPSKVRVPTSAPFVFALAGTQHSKGGGADLCHHAGKSTEISVRLSGVFLSGVVHQFCLLDDFNIAAR